MKRSISSLLWIFLFALPSFAQVTNLDDQPPYTAANSNWNVCIEPHCNPGGLVYSGTVTTSGTTVTWISGTQFTGQTAGNLIQINGTTYTIAGAITATSLVVATSAGTQSVPVSYVAGPTVIQTINNTTHQLDGASMQISCASGVASDCLEYYDAGAQDSNTYLTMDFWIYFDSTYTSANAFEFVMFQYVQATTNAEMHWSYQCDQNSGFWRIGNMAPTFSWNATTIPCPNTSNGLASAFENTWHHIIFHSHWVNGDTSCSGYPALHYDKITIDNTTTTGLPSYCSIVLPGGYSENTGINFQQDMGTGGAPGTLSQWEDHVNFYTTTAAPSSYYISAAGSDSNAGTEASPWLHAPGMNTATGTPASYSCNPGDEFIFRGGDTWNYGNSSAAPYFATWTWGCSGTSSAPIYLGVDQTWYTGGSWVRPVMSGNNSLSTAFVGSCTYNQSTVMGLKLNGVSYVAEDNFEWPGRCWSSASPNSGAIYSYQTCNVTISNNYFHGWTATFASGDDQLLLGNITGSCGAANNNVIVGNVFDGSDSSASSGACGQGYNPTGLCRSGLGVYGDGYDLHQNVFRYMANFDVAPNFCTAHDNLFEYLYTTYAPGGQHSNVINNNASGACSVETFYNNVIRHNFVTELNYFYLPSGGTLYAFGNVWFDNLKSNSTTTSPQNCISLESSGGTTAAYFYGNTFDNDTDDATGAGCTMTVIGTPSNAHAWSGNVYFANNDLIGYTALSSICCTQLGSGTSYTNVSNGTNLFAVTATARAQGYTQANNNAPSAGGSTIHAGTNFTSSCPTFSSDSALCSGTSFGVSEQSGSGGFVASYPAIPITSRSTTWDIGAYQFLVSVLNGSQPFAIYP